MIQPHHVVAVGDGGAERGQDARRGVADVGQRGHGFVAGGRRLRIGRGGVDGGADTVGGVAKGGEIGGQLVVEGVDAAGFGVVDRRGERGDGGLEPLCEFGFDEPGRATVSDAEGGGGQFAGRDARDPVDEFVGLVDDEQVVFGQHVDVGDGVDGEQGVVGDDDVGVAGVASCAFSAKQSVPYGQRVAPMHSRADTLT